MQLRAPAKINLSFRILHQRPDGFHEVETFMTPISLCDELIIERAEQNRGIHFVCDDPSLSVGSDNLVVRAAELFFENAKKGPVVEITLRKKIPHSAGLGGGSSDAAATLRALNELFATNWPREKIAEIATQIGSDVPFFVHESAALCRGRGEIVTPTRLEEKFPLLLLKPAFGISTSWAYSRWQNSRELPEVSYLEQKFADLTLVNDLERPVFEKFVFLAEVKMWLRRQPEVTAALLSGSGSTVFAVMRPNADVDLVAKRARKELDREIWTCACETLEGAALSAS